MPNIFISYRRDDSAYAASAIKEKLEDAFGESSVFFDIDNIPLGVDFRQYISSAVGNCDVLLALIGDQWLEANADTGLRRIDEPTDFVRLEIEAALKRQIPVVPVLIGKATMPNAEVLPEGIKELAYRNAAEVRSGRDHSHHVQQLIQALKETRTPKERNPTSAPESRSERGRTRQLPNRRPAKPKEKSPSSPSTNSTPTTSKSLYSIRSLTVAAFFALFPAQILALFTWHMLAAMGAVESPSIKHPMFLPWYGLWFSATMTVIVTRHRWRSPRKKQ